MSEMPYNTSASSYSHTPHIPQAQHIMKKFFKSPYPSDQSGVAQSTGAPDPSVASRAFTPQAMQTKGTPQKNTRIAKFLLILLIAVNLVTSVITISDNINTLIALSSVASGAYHLLQVRDTFTNLKNHPNEIKEDKLHEMQGELDAAHNDFQRLHDSLDRTVILTSIHSTYPQQADSIRALSQIGADAADVGHELTNLAIDFLPDLHGSLLDDTGQPLIKPNMLPRVHQAVDYIQPRVKRIEEQSHLVSLEVLPISASQRSQLAQIFGVLPQVQVGVNLIHDNFDAFAWLLGVNEPRNLLIETMDRAELRATGGFNGQYGELLIKGGRIAPFKIQNIALSEYGDNSKTYGQAAPTPYAWWPIDNWGLRDANLSADFPTSAKLALNAYKHEFSKQADGVVFFSVFLIARVLSITGPITIPEYSETITSANLEDRLHHYQLDNTYIRKAELIEHVESGDIARKLFTARLSKVLMDTLRHASIGQLIGLSNEMLYGLQTKDLQVYFSNQQLEGLLVKYNAAAQVDRSLTHDGLFVVQANLNANKASQYVRTAMQDTVTLDKAGGATHVLQLRLFYNKVGDVWGPDGYHDYVRVYVPPTSQYLRGNGFEQIGKPLCGASAGLVACPIYNPYGTGDLLCPAGQSDPGTETPLLNDVYYHQNHPLNNEGPPTNKTSDEQGRSMYSGWVMVPKNCVATVTLSWYVPPLSQSHYTLLVQHQSGVATELDLTILPTPGDCSELKTDGTHVNMVMTQDQAFTADQHAQGNEGTSCYSQPGI